MVLKCLASMEFNATAGHARLKRLASGDSSKIVSLAPSEPETCLP